MRAPAESTSQTTGSSWRRASSVRRTIFSTVRPPRPRLHRRIVGHHADRAPVDLAQPGDDAVGGEVGRPRRSPAARPRRTTRVAAAARCGRGRRACAAGRASRPPVEVARERPARSPRPAAGDPVESPVLRHTEWRRAARRARSPRSAEACSAADGEDGDVVADRAVGEVAGRLQQLLAQHVGAIPGSRRRVLAMRSSPKTSPLLRASLSPSV